MVATAPIQPIPDVLLRGISWQTYQALVRELESQPGKRLSYDNGLLEIFMPLPPHEKNKKYAARFVEILTEEWDIEICSLGSCTWSRQDLAKGVEADECYYIQNEAVIRGKVAIDLMIDPPPDLVIEIDMTSPSMPRLPLYAALRIPEVWQFDGTHMRFSCLNEGEYRQENQSRALPQVTSEILETWLVQAMTMGETSWARALRVWAREHRLSH
jgi:Uma2 family endonuclease